MVGRFLEVLLPRLPPMAAAASASALVAYGRAVMQVSPPSKTALLPLLR